MIGPHRGHPRPSARHVGLRTADRLGIVAGLVLCGAGWAIAGCLAGASRSAGWAVLICAIAGLVTPWRVWLAQMAGENQGWFVGRGTWGLVIQFGSALQTRLLFVAALLVYC